MGDSESVIVLSSLGMKGHSRVGIDATALLRSRINNNMIMSFATCLTLSVSTFVPALFELSLTVVETCGSAPLTARAEIGTQYL